MKKFVDVGGDEMSMDDQGNIYISNGLGITAFDPKGNKIFNVPTNDATKMFLEVKIIKPYSLQGLWTS